MSDVREVWCESCGKTGKVDYHGAGYRHFCKHCTTGLNQQTMFRRSVCNGCGKPGDLSSGRCLKCEDEFYGGHARQTANSHAINQAKFKKDDGGKPRPDLLPPHAMLEVSRVLSFGAAKYGANNWNQADVEDGRARYVAAAMRHVLQYQCGEQIDGESGLNHLAHAIASLSFVLERDITEE